MMLVLMLIMQLYLCPMLKIEETSPEKCQPQLGLPTVTSLGRPQDRPSRHASRANIAANVQALDTWSRSISFAP